MPPSSRFGPNLANNGNELTKIDEIMIAKLAGEAVVKIVKQCDEAKENSKLDLNLANNEIYKLPDEFCGLTLLVRLDISNNYLLDLPAVLFKLPKLRQLKAHHNAIIDDSHHCFECNINFELSTMLLMHNLNIHRKTAMSHRKISSFLSNLLETENIYSSDSDCEYQITTTVRRVAKIKPEVKSQTDSDDAKPTSRVTRRAGSVATIKREMIEIDRSNNKCYSGVSCHICGTTLGNSNFLEEHIKVEHGEDNDNDFDFLSEYGVQGMDFNHFSENGSITKPDMPRTRIKTKKFSCDICSKQFKQKFTLAKHLQQHRTIDDAKVEVDEEVSDTRSDNWDSDDSDSLNSKSKSLSGFPCNLCGKIYERKDLIIKHFTTFHPQDENALSATIDVINKHNGDGFPCTLCPIIQPNRDSLHRHLRRTHQIRSKESESKCWTCEICGKVFYRPKCFATHLRKHSETAVEKRRTKSPKKKTHLCSFCGKSYPGSNHLKIHLRIHTGERPFSCDYCSKTFAIKKTWQDHTYSHTGEKPYFCPVENCGKRFTHSTGVRQHMQCCHSSEKQFQCPHCDKKCSKKTHLEDHIRSHTGERPYECKYCGIKFRLTSTLRIHHRTHTGERPFVCKVCNRGFIKSYGLKQHMKSKRNCLPATVQPTTLSSENEQQQQQPAAIIIPTDAVQFQQIIILPSHQELS